MGAVELGEVEIGDDSDLLKEVVIADVHLVTEIIKVVVLVNMSLVEVVSMVEAVDSVVSWICNIPPPCCFSLCEQSK